MDLHWRIYYGDGSTWSDQDGPPEQAPACDVQMIAVADHDHGWRLERSNDFYVWRHQADDWRGCDHFGLWDYLTQPGLKRVLFGRTIADSEFRAVLQRALNDPEIPKKTGWQPGERAAGGIA